MAGIGLYPLINWFDFGATAFVLLIAAMLLGAMFLFVRLASDDSDKFKELKEMVETLFGTPAHLRADSSDRSLGGRAGDTAVSKSTPSSIGLTPFSEPCPACHHIVTEENGDCPSCGLRLL